MNEHPILDGLRLGLEVISALVGLIYLFKLRKSYWKWFSIYLIFIVLQEIIWLGKRSFLGLIDRDYFAYVGIPIQFLFFYWLYAYKSLKLKKIFWIFSFVYLVNLPLKLFIEENDQVYSINVGVGTILLSILVILEFFKQIKNENILQFWQNKMFYINVGVILYYIGTLPFQVFFDYLKDNNKTILDYYYVYFLIANCFMYLLFSISFLCGNQKS
ncbi:hypothetical protein ATE84_2856 [Aquimarina sp. MAR_2010_214]|uniref:hypothetical protein n=1 Tax=Aquimarina sp. MAR_2010_214 TaxID=1250026 RepID=UPI000C703651|nr:hypothetical protein [Aquimarina sp. MAR_2010_214]PKV50789.1 hypothetical protein ATE84_2856 [Aquimarina sp. MAR_2010_214]